MSAKGSNSCIVFPSWQRNSDILFRLWWQYSEARLHRNDTNDAVCSNPYVTWSSNWKDAMRGKYLYRNLNYFLLTYEIYIGRLISKDYLPMHIERLTRKLKIYLCNNCSTSLLPYIPLSLSLSHILSLSLSPSLPRTDTPPLSLSLSLSLYLHPLLLFLLSLHLRLTFSVTFVKPTHSLSISFLSRRGSTGGGGGFRGFNPPPPLGRPTKKKGKKKGKKKKKRKKKRTHAGEKPLQVQILWEDIQPIW